MGRKRRSPSWSAIAILVACLLAASCGASHSRVSARQTTTTLPHPTTTSLPANVRDIIPVFTLKGLHAVDDVTSPREIATAVRRFEAGCTDVSSGPDPQRAGLGKIRADEVHCHAFPNGDLTPTLTILVFPDDAHRAQAVAPVAGVLCAVPGNNADFAAAHNWIVVTDPGTQVVGPASLLGATDDGADCRRPSA